MLRVWDPRVQPRTMGEGLLELQLKGLEGWPILRLHLPTLAHDVIHPIRAGVWLVHHVAILNLLQDFINHLLQRRRKEGMCVKCGTHTHTHTHTHTQANSSNLAIHYASIARA